VERKLIAQVWKGEVPCTMVDLIEERTLVLTNSL
jgi:hypothetical protein